MGEVFGICKREEKKGTRGGGKKGNKGGKWEGNNGGEAAERCIKRMEKNNEVCKYQ
jgi:hypothetical protein